MTPSACGIPCGNPRAPRWVCRCPRIWRSLRPGDAAVPCKKGLKELLAALEDMGLPRIVASSSPRNMIEMNLQTTGTARYFHDVVSGTEVAHSKPAPDTFLVAAKKLHLDPHDCLVLEDSFNGVRAGRAAGCVTVMVPDLMQPTEEIAQLYDRKCEDLLEVRDLLIEGKL